MHFLQKVERLLEILLGFAREAHDNVCGDGNLALCLFHPRNSLHILLARVEALHAAQHVAGSALHRKVYVVTEDRIGVNGINDGLDEIPRMGSGEAYPADSPNGSNFVQQRGEVPPGR